MKYEFRVGTSEPLDIQITVTPTQAAAGLTPTLVITDRYGAVPSTPPTVAWLDISLWKVRISGLENLTVALAPYSTRVRLTDGGGKIGFAPTGAHPDLLIPVSP